jgi:hypothetical protein
MWEKLARHAKVELKPPQNSESPKEKLPPLVWEKPVKTGELSGYVLTQCGGFSISKDSVNGAVMYTAWLRTTKPATNLGVRLGRVEAEHLCELAR